MKNISITVILLFSFVSVFAQSADELFLYSNQSFYGTARSAAMGGAFSSVGGDISAASNNPAGLGLFRYSTMSITPGFQIEEVKGNGASGITTKFTLPSMGLLWSFNNKDIGHKNFNLGVTYTRGANFNQSFQLDEYNSSNSLLDSIAKMANEPHPYIESKLGNYMVENPLASMAYNNYLISFDKGLDKYLPVLDMSLDKVDIFRDYNKKGALNELALSLAGNYEDLIYWGVTFGVQDIFYDRSTKYEEKVVDRGKASNILDRFYDYKYIKTRGTGVNFKCGLVLRPITNVRLGVAAHSPTYYEVEDEYELSMESYFYEEPKKGEGFDFKQTFPTDESVGVYEYAFLTPWKFIFGSSFLFDNLGLLSVDYEVIDYSTARFVKDGTFEVENKNMKNHYALTGNWKIGMEVRLCKEFLIRGGYNRFGNVFKKEALQKQVSNQYSFGVGYRYENLFFDLSAQFHRQNNEFFAETSYKKISERKFNSKQFKFTVGLYF